jgi:hypothetical protein
MKNILEYNAYIQTLEAQAKGGLFFHHINQQIYITDFSNRLLGIWDLELGHSIQWKNAQ